MTLLIVGLVLVFGAVLGVVTCITTKYKAWSGLAVVCCVGAIVIMFALWTVLGLWSGARVQSLRTFSSQTVGCYAYLGGETGNPELAQALDEYNNDLARYKSWNGHWLMGAFLYDPTGIDYITISPSDTPEE